MHSYQLEERKQHAGQDGIPRFYQRLSDNGFPIILRTPWIELERITFSSNVYGVFVAVPMDVNTRSTLDSIEAFVMETITIPDELESIHIGKTYKPLYRGETMNIKVDGDCWCLYYPPHDKSPELRAVHELAKRRKAKYRFAIKACQVYIVPHKDGSLASILLKMDCIEFKDT